MILVYQWTEDLMEFKLYSCAETIQSSVDHLHFTLHLRKDYYYEDCTGELSISQADTQETLAKRITEFYAEQLVKIRNSPAPEGYEGMHALH